MLANAGVPVGVMVAPLIPGLTDEEMPAILAAAAQAGATEAGFVPMRLPLAVAPLFVEWLEAHFPDRKDKILARVRDVRAGKLNDPRMVSRMRGEGVYADQLRALFHLHARKYHLNEREFALSSEHFKRPPGPGGEQLGLF